MPAMHKEYMDKVSKLKLMKSVPQYKIMSEISKLELKEYDFMFAIHPDDVKDSIRNMNLSFHLHVMRGGDSKPSGYYYHVLHNNKEHARLVEPPSGSTYVVTMPYLLESYNPINLCI
ncbi:hypothetical protein Tco_0333960, partial [Tanacetum coccineum]